MEQIEILEYALETAENNADRARLNQIEDGYSLMSTEKYERAEKIVNFLKQKIDEHFT